MMSMPDDAGRRSTDGVAWNWLSPRCRVACCHSCLGQMRVLRRLLDHALMDRRDGPRRVLARGNIDRNLIPHPLPGGREVEVLPGDREVVDEGHPPPGRVSLVGPVAGLEQRGAEHPDLHHLAAHRVDLHPVAHMDPVAAPSG